MSDDQKPAEPMTDETIETIVTMIESYEILAASLNMSVSAAARAMLKSMQILARRGQSQTGSLAQMFTASTKVQ